MAPKQGKSGRGARGRAVRTIMVLAAALGLAAGGAALFLRGRGAPGEDPAMRRIEPLAPADIRWPAVGPEAAPYLEVGQRELARAASLYSAGERDAADSAVFEAIRNLERAGALVPDVGPHHAQTVVSAVEKSDLATAEARAARWLEKSPDDFDHLFLLGKLRYQARKWSLAADCFRKASAKQPGSAEVARWLAQTCSQMGAQEEAVQAVRRSLDLVGFPGGQFRVHPLGKAVLGNAIAVLHRFQEYELLGQVASAYRAGFGDNGEAVMAEGVALASSGRHAEAEPLLLRALADPSNAENADDIAFTLGLSFSKQGKWAEAARALARLLEADPFHARGYYQLGMALQRLGRKEAEVMIAKSRDLAPSDREMRRERELRGAGEHGRGAAAAAKGHAMRAEFDRAEQALRREELKTDPIAIFALADLYLDILRVADAERVLAHAAAVVGAEHIDVVARGAVARFLRGEVDRALAVLAAIAEKEKGRTDPYWSLRYGGILLEERRFGEAEKLLASLRRSDADREASFLLARALLGKSEARRALQLLRTISIGDTRWDDWEADAWVALALLQSGDASPAELDEASGLLQVFPPQARGSEVWLRAQALLLERRGDQPSELARLAGVLGRREAARSAVKDLERRIAAASWTQSASTRLDLARLLHSVGDLKAAVRHARLALLAAPASVEALRALEEWLRADEDVFLRLRVLHEIARLSPGDQGVREAIARIEATWLRW